MPQECVASAFGYSIGGIPLWLGWVPVFGLLLFFRYRLKHWDPAWRENWERRHKKSIATLRQDLARGEKYLRASIWLLIAAILFELGASWELAGMLSESGAFQEHVLRLCTKLGFVMITFFPALIGFVLVLMNVKNRLRKLDELLGTIGIQN